MNGLDDRRRIACVIVGWNGPPWGECLERWVGSVCPNVKNAASGLYACGEKL